MSGSYRIEVSHTSRFVRAPGVKLKRVGRATAAYIGDPPAIHVLNPAAELIYRSLETPLSRDELVGLLGELTEASPEAIDRDLQEFLPQLLKLRLVEPVE